MSKRVLALLAAGHLSSQHTENEFMLSYFPYTTRRKHLPETYFQCTWSRL